MTRRPLLALCTITLAGLCQFAAAQGSLTPPGAPAPTMKSLDQIYDAISSSPVNAGRTAITAADLPLTISTPGSYYLAESITFLTDAHGITINTSDVTLDLNGFVLQGPGKDTGSPNSTGIRLVDGPSRVVVKNGTVRDWPTSGVAWSNATPSYCIAQNLRIFDIGGVGLSFGSGATVEDCLVVSVNNSGVFLSDRAVVRRTTVRSAGTTTSSNAFSIGANGLAEDCQAFNNIGRGFTSSSQTRFKDCRAISNGSSGFHTGDINDVHYVDCTAEANTGSGFVGGWRNQFIGCTSRGNAQHGIQISGTSPQAMKIDSCHVVSNSLDGLSAVGSFRGQVVDSYFALNGQDGIDAGGSWLVANNQCNANGTETGFTTGAGVRTEGGSTVRGNACQSNDIGIACTTNTSYFASNTLNSNTTAKSLAGSTEGTGDLVNVSF